MDDYLLKLLKIADENVKKNPSLVGADTSEIARKYLKGLGNEVGEVEEEFKDNNVVYLEDELSDIAWNYLMVLKICEERGWIDSVEKVFEHALKKYTERAPAFLKFDQVMWDEIKDKQKVELKQEHDERYGL